MDCYITFKNRDIILDEEDYYKLYFYNWQLSNIKSKFLCYLFRSEKIPNSKKYKRILMHREILNVTDSKQIVDHINGNTLDNRKCNLRIVDYKIHNRNRRSHYNATSKYLGVFFNKKNKNWRAQININRKPICLGSFKTQEEAFIARQDYIQFNQLIGFRKVG